MAVAELPNKLSELHGLVSSTRSQHAAEKAQEVVVDLAYMCLRQMPDNEIGERAEFYVVFSDHSIALHYHVCHFVSQHGWMGGP